MSCGENTNSDDSQLIQEVQRGNVQSFQTLVTRYQKRAYHIVLGFVNNREDLTSINMMKGTRTDPTTDTLLVQVL